MADELLSPPKPLEIFVGRKEELEWLARETHDRERGFPDMPVVIAGMAGVGKTALAAQFVSRLPDTERTVWIPCRKFDKDTAAFQIAIRRGSRGRLPRRVLVVLDGADEVPEETFRNIFYEVINHKIVRSVIITTRGARFIRVSDQRSLHGTASGDRQRKPTGDFARQQDSAVNGPAATAAGSRWPFI